MARDAGKLIVTYFEHPNYRLDIGLPKLVEIGANGVPVGPPLDLGHRSPSYVGDADRLSVTAGGTDASVTWVELDPLLGEDAVRLLRFTP